MYKYGLTYDVECMIMDTNKVFMKGFDYMTVEPIKSREQIEKMKNILLKQSFRNYMLFTLGINTGFRIGDILKLTVQDVKDQVYIDVIEEKTGKRRKHYITDSLRQELDRYIEGMEYTDYLFTSRKGSNKAITRVQAYRILEGAGTLIGLHNIGSHTLRKTYGYYHYLTNKDVVILQKTFGHSAPSITLKYIGIEQEEIDESTKTFYL